MDGLRLAGDVMRIAQLGLDVTSNNLANVNTPGFKSGSVRNQTGPGGRGVGAGAISESMSPGPVALTGQPLDLAIEGDGYFAVRTGTGRLAFTRDGSFQIDAAGRIATPDGALLDPPITVPPDARSIAVGVDGAVRATGADGRPVDVGRIRPVRFANPEGLSSIGGNLQVPTPNSGAGMRVEQSMRAGMIELSNTDLATEMVNLIRDEKFSRVGVTLARTEDEMLGSVLDLKR